jgi:hypothetical protein
VYTQTVSQPPSKRRDQYVYIIAYDPGIATHPMVVMKLEVKASSANRNKRQLFPTPARAGANVIVWLCAHTNMLKR